MTIHLGWQWVVVDSKMAMRLFAMELGGTNHNFEESPLQYDNN